MKKPYAIEVPSCRAVVVSGVDLQEGDAFVVHRLIDSSCAIDDAKDIPFTPCGKIVRLDSTHNPIILEMPGRYRVYPDGAVSDTASLWIDTVSACGK